MSADRQDARSAATDWREEAIHYKALLSEALAENERLRVALTAIIALAQSPSWEVANDALN